MKKAAGSQHYYREVGGRVGKKDGQGVGVMARYRRQNVTTEKLDKE